ncbi:MAG: hypothetical protein KC475_07895 [Cyanobacteria bacterium HKST-UBA03]|nr:hypothetical protein [Cyanobacteria bacterium HKST-UBA03]
MFNTSFPGTLGSLNAGAQIFQPSNPFSNQILSSGAFIRQAGIGIPGSAQLFTRLNAFGGAPFGTTPVGGGTSYQQAATELRYAQNLYAPDHPTRKLLGYLYDGMVFGLRNPDVLDQQSTRVARNLIFNSERPFADVDRQVNGLPDNQTINQLFAGTPELFRGVSGLQITPSETLDRLGVFTPQIANTFPQQAIGLFPVPPSTSQAPVFSNSPFSAGLSFGAINAGLSNLGAGLASNNSILTGPGITGQGSFFSPSGNEAFAPNLGITPGTGISGSAIERLLLALI